MNFRFEYFNVHNLIFFSDANIEKRRMVDFAYLGVPPFQSPDGSYKNLSKNFVYY
jgi:hypothetical protein